VNDLSAVILELAKGHQKGRADSESANAYFNFTEGWFRNSGLYDLNEISYTLAENDDAFEIENTRKRFN